MVILLKKSDFPAIVGGKTQGKIILFSCAGYVNEVGHDMERQKSSRFLL